ncbi:MAG TPA: GNAT family protein [Longimicrobium sp.]|nr:GNAT family protein [Longimicrobium sp.]
MNTPPYRVVTPRLVIRCYRPEDAPALEAAIHASLDHLRPWLPWAHDEPEPLQAKVERLRMFRGKFDLDQDYVYATFSADESRLVGGTGLHPRVGPDALEIGYWIAAPDAEKGLATEAGAALTRVAFDIVGVRRMEIRCDPRNVRSAAVPRKLGYTHEATLRGRVAIPGGPAHDVMSWILLRDDYAGTPSAGAEVEAFDVLGRKLL